MVPDRVAEFGHGVAERSRTLFSKGQTFVQNLRERVEGIETNRLQTLQERLSLSSDNQLIQQFKRFRIREGIAWGGYFIGWVGIGATMMKAMSEGNGGYNAWGEAVYGGILLNTAVSWGLMKAIDRRENVVFEEAEKRPTLQVKRSGSTLTYRISPRQLPPNGFSAPISS